jgi:RNA polymerase sigma factor for flagellar operon FliA
MGVVESRVSQVHASAVVHLRSALKDLAAHGAFDRPLARKPAERTRR